MSDPKNTHILIIEDDLKLAKLMQDYLTLRDYKVSLAETGPQGLTMASEIQPQLIILDLMLPQMDGIMVCQQLKTWYKNRILVLSASDDDMDQVSVLEMGADDFVQKPIHPRVLLARIRTLLRRDHISSDSSNETAVAKEPVTNLCFGQLNLHFGRRQVSLNDQPVNLTETEFELLWLLASNPEKTLSRDQISQTLRGIEYDGLDRIIDNRIMSLRRKLGDNEGLAKRIITVRSKGYLFTTDQW